MIRYLVIIFICALISSESVLAVQCQKAPDCNRQAIFKAKPKDCPEVMIHFVRCGQTLYASVVKAQGVSYPWECTFAKTGEKPAFPDGLTQAEQGACTASLRAGSFDAGGAPVISEDGPTFRMGPVEPAPDFNRLMEEVKGRR